MSPNKYNPIPLERASWPLSGGVDTKVHGLVVPPPKLQECINAYSDQTGSLLRRYGLTALSEKDVTDTTIATGSWQALALHQGRLLGAKAQLELYDYGETDARWADRGRLASWPVKTSSVEALNMSATFPASKDMAIIGAYKLYAYDTYTEAAGVYTTATAFTLVDAAGTRYASAQTLVGATAGTLFSSVKVVSFGTRFYIVYHDISTASAIKCFIIDTTSAATIASSLAASATTLVNTWGGVIDVATHNTYGPVMAWITTTANQIGLAQITTAGALTGSTTFATVAAPLSCSVACLTNVGVVYTRNAAADLYAKLYSYNGTAFTLLQTSGALDVAAAASPSCIWTSATSLRIFYAGTLSVYPCIYQTFYTTSGATAARVQTLPRSIQIARPFIVDGADSQVYFWCVSEPYGGTAQPTAYLMRYDGLVTAMAGRGLTTFSLASLAFGMPHMPVGVAADGGNYYSLLTDQFTRIGSGTGFDVFLPGTGTTSAMVNVDVFTTGYSSWANVEDGKCTYFAGGILQQYDGVGATEVNFLTYVDNQNRTVITQGGGGALTLLATYYYRCVQEFTNGQGEREQGTDNGSKGFTLTGANNSLTLAVDCVPWTLKKSPRPNFVYAFYRTLNGATATSAYYRVGQVANNPGLDRVSFTDTMSDAAAALQEQLYMGSGGAGAELDNLSPPAASIVAAGNGRVFCAGFPEDPNLVMYSKARSHGQALAFNDALQIIVPEADGPITALAVFAEYLLIFCERGIYRVNGGGLNNTGLQGGYTEPVRVQTDDGTTHPRTICVTPAGVMYQATKGIMLMSSSFQVQYVGAPVEKLLTSTSPPIVSAVLVPERQQVRFAKTAGYMLVYDYYHAQWYQFTQTSEGPCVLWNGAHANINGVVEYDDPAVFTDNGVHYEVTITLGWMHGSALPSDLAIRRIALTGQTVGASVFLMILVKKDQSTTTNQTITDLRAQGPLQRQFRIKEQVVSQMQITIGDWNTSLYGFPFSMPNAGFCLNELSFELALRSAEFGRKG